MSETISSVTLGLDPIPGDSPVGEPVTYEPSFEELSAEIAKLDSLADGSEVRWPRVVELGTLILAEKSKDMQAAAYRAHGLFVLQGYSGLENGLTVVRDLMNTFWEDMFPPLKRLRGRKQALEWLADRAVTLLESNPPKNVEHLGVCIERMQEVDTVARERFGDNPPGITKLLVKLRELQRALEQGGASAGGEDGENGNGAVLTIAAQAPAGPPGAITSRKQAYETLKKVSEYLRKHDPHSPVGYLLERAQAWGEMSYEQLYKDLMSRHGDARQMLWWVLGIKEDS